jgi:23S rRNA (uracil1939-C5)-methyltransferase
VRLEIESLAYGGDGVAHSPDGLTVFIPDTCPGDVVDVEIEQDRGRWARARLLSIVEASPDRVSPPCPHFGTCGGCQWQHVSYEAQLTAKRRAVTEALSRIGGQEAEALVSPCIPSGREYGYRNKIELRCDEAGPSSLGLTARDGRTLIPIDRCLLLPKKHAGAPRKVRGALKYIAGDQSLGLKRVGVRFAERRPDVEIAIWTAPGPFPRSLAAKTLNDSMQATSVVRVLTKGPDKARRVSKVEVLAGKGFWRERLAGFTMSISAPSFFQVNTATAELMVAKAVDALDPGEDDIVLDCYSGAGTFTLKLAERADDVVAIESSSTAIQDLRRNLENAELHADVVGGDATRELPDLGHFDRILVDPPRTGLAPEALAALASAGATRIVYVSCDPATLARDAGSLKDRGYHLAEVTPVDLFPQTYHVESIAVFDRD